MSSKSLSDVAYDVLTSKKEACLFNELWATVCKEHNIPESKAKRKAVSFYNALMLDSRFISLEGNTWDLRERHTDDGLNIDPDLLEAFDDYEDFED